MPWPTPVLFWLFAAVTASAGAVGVVAMTREIVRAAACSCSFALARRRRRCYFLLDAEFLAAVQLVVYTGGILILIIFGVMLTSRVAGPVRYRAVPPARSSVAAVGRRPCCCRDADAGRRAVRRRFRLVARPGRSRQPAAGSCLDRRCSATMLSRSRSPACCCWS